MAKIVEMIETDERRGTGREGDPMRRVYQLWTKDGRLVHENDAHDRELDRKIEDLKHQAEIERALRIGAVAFLEAEFMNGRGVPARRGWRECMEHLLKKAQSKLSGDDGMDQAARGRGPVG